MSGTQVLGRIRGPAAAAPNPATPRARRGRVGRLFFAAINVVLVAAIAAIVLFDLGVAGNPWYQIVGITGGSMEPAIRRGDLVIVAPPPARVEPGMVLLMAVGGDVVTHRVAAVNADGSFVTRGDANRVDDNWAGRPIRIAGLYVATIPLLGRVLPIQRGSDASFVDRTSATMQFTVGPWTTGVAATPAQEPQPNEAGWNNTDVVVTWNWSDTGAGIDPATCPPSSTSIGEGALVLTASCTDRAGVSGDASWAVNVDLTPPAVTIDTHPADSTEASSAAFTFTAADEGGSGLDPITCAIDEGPATTCEAPGSQGYAGLANGPHTFTVTATDLAGNKSQATFSWVVGAPGPTIAVTHAADGSNGWNRSSPVVLSIGVTEGEAPVPHRPACTDNGDPLTASGSAPTHAASIVGDGVHEITCTITDNAGVEATARDTVKLDATNPTINVPADIAVDASGADGAVVTYAVAIADATSGLAASDCAPASGETFAIGTSTVACTATDEAGNGASGSFRVTVRPMSQGAPVAAPTQAPAANGDGWNSTDVVVTWHWTSTGAAIDPTRCADTSTSSGEGTITLTATCTTVTGVTGSGSWAVAVDRTKPAVVITGHPGSSSASISAAFAFAATDAGGSGVATLTCALDGGAATPCSTDTTQAYEGLAGGPHRFTVTATDRAGNSSQATFSWCVNTSQGPSISIDHAVDGSNGWNRTSPVPLVIAVTAGSSAIASPPTCTDNGRALLVTGQASPFGAGIDADGTHAVTCKVTDAAGRSASASDSVRLDTLKPVIAVPADLDVETFDEDGEAVEYTASFSDATSGLATKGCAPASGSTFPVDVTTVTCSATDKAGNSRSATFTVTVTVQTAREAVEAVLRSLESELGSTTGKDRRNRLSTAIGHLEDGLATGLWVTSGPLDDGNHLDAERGEGAFDENRAAVDALQGIKKPSNVIKAAIADIAAAAEFLAQTAIDDAKDANVDPRDVSAAQKELSNADDDLEKGRPDLAINHWKAAWRLVTPAPESAG